MGAGILLLYWRVLSFQKIQLKVHASGPSCPPVAIKSKKVYCSDLSSGVVTYLGLAIKWHCRAWVNNFSRATLEKSTAIFWYLHYITVHAGGSEYVPRSRCSFSQLCLVRQPPCLLLFLVPLLVNTFPVVNVAPRLKLSVAYVAQIWSCPEVGTLVDVQCLQTGHGQSAPTLFAAIFIGRRVWFSVTFRRAIWLAAVPEQ